EILGNTLSTVVEYQGQVYGDIEVDAQHISSESSPEGGSNMGCTFTKPNRSAHTPNFRVFSGQLPCFGDGGFGTGGCLGTLGGGLHGTYVELTTVKKRMLKNKKRATLEAISKDVGCEILRSTLSTVVEYQGQLDGDIEVDAQYISSKSSAKAHGSFKISQALKEGAAWGLWWLPESAHTPNFRVFSGQLACFGDGGFGTGGCLGTLGGGLHGTYVELTTVKKRMLRDKRRAALEAIIKDVESCSLLEH
ncbi:hypothetical protein CR513_04329, partial [Mucuna pruriens]